MIRLLRTKKDHYLVVADGYFIGKIEKPYSEHGTYAVKPDYEPGDVWYLGNSTIEEAAILCLDEYHNKLGEIAEREFWKCKCEHCRKH